MDKVALPNDEQFITDLILQRTGPFLKYGGGQALNRWFSSGNRSSLYAFLVGNNLVEQYVRDVLKHVATEADALLASLPASSLKNIASIGPGNGILELFLASRAGTEHILLIDIEQTSDHHHGFNAQGSGYASLDMTRSFLVANGIAAAAIETCNPSKSPLPQRSCSLFISLLSMGFHYPCDEYVDFISSNAAPGAYLVLDKRRGAPDLGFDRLATSFQLRQTIAAEKSDRLFLAL